MNSVVVQTRPQSALETKFLSEILPLIILKDSKLNFICFRLSPEVEREIGNRLSWRFSQKFPDVIVIWDKKFFWALAKSNQVMPSQKEWRETLTEICDELRKDIGDCDYFIQWVRQPQLTAFILAQLAVRILKITRPFSSETALSEKQVEVKREANFWAETIEIKNQSFSALTITVKSNFRYKGNLADFFENHPLIGLKVRDIEHNSFATITGIIGNIAEHRERLIEDATGAISKQALEEAPDEQPVVTVQFGKNSKQFRYAMAALRPCVTAETANKFEVDYGKLLKATKVAYRGRKELLEVYKKEANLVLANYGLKLGRSINSSSYSQLFWEPRLKLSETKLLFGNNVIGLQQRILTGLSQGGVYSRHENYQNPSDKIKIAALKIGNFQVGKLFFNQVQQRLQKYGFGSIIPPENMKIVSEENYTSIEGRIKIEEAIDDLMERHPYIVLLFLPI